MIAGVVRTFARVAVDERPAQVGSDVLQVGMGGIDPGIDDGDSRPVAGRVVVSFEGVGDPFVPLEFGKGGVLGGVSLRYWIGEFDREIARDGVDAAYRTEVVLRILGPRDHEHGAAGEFAFDREAGVSEPSTISAGGDVALFFLCAGGADGSKADSRRRDTPQQSSSIYTMIFH